jgi:hypothetical protein
LVDGPKGEENYPAIEQKPHHGPRELPQPHGKAYQPDNELGEKNDRDEI